MSIFRSAWAVTGLVLLFLLLFLFGGPENRFDVWLIHALEDIRHAFPKTTSAIVVVTQVGSAYVTLGAAVVSALILLSTGRRSQALLLIAGAAVERLMLDGLKLIVGRPRPDFDLHPVATHSSSYPSGHSANTMAIFLMIAVTLAPSRHRRAALWLAVGLALISGMTRPFLGVHWPTDVLGGWTLGLIAFWAYLRVGERSGILPSEQQHEIVGGHGATLEKA